MEGADSQTRKPGWLRTIVIGRNPKRTLVRIAVLVTTCAIVFRFILLPIRVDGISMLPTYHTGELDCVNRLAYLRHEPRRGDVVSVRLAKPDGFAPPKVMYMKRVIGLPGETVSFRHGHTFIDGRQLDEPYLKLPCDWNEGPFLCGPDEYYVVGDNRSMPFFLHYQGRAHRDHIVGKVLL